MKDELTIFWFRRDLRLEDNAGLFHALKSSDKVLPIFIFDTNILDKLEDSSDKRVNFIYDTLEQLNQRLQSMGSCLKIYIGNPIQIWNEILGNFRVKEVFTNHDYEMYAMSRDSEVKKLLHSNNISFHTFKDQVIFEKEEILSGTGTPYTVFTPYSKKWKATLLPQSYQPYPTNELWNHFLKINTNDFPSIEQIGFKSSPSGVSPITIDDTIIKNYAKQRDFPSLRGTTRLSVHLRFGTISIRALVKKALELDETWLNELIWREFYMSIIYNFPHVSKGQAFKKEYDCIKWRNNEKEFEAWCLGKTGYPIVDAGMRELNETGFMHNRVRMITASFLIKHLLIDWRWGEAYFAKKLLDFDFAANNGGWQWAASSGCDAVPYFRIFNPTSQTLKFDPDLKYIKKWVPELNSFAYPKPIVEHQFARERVLNVYKNALK